MTLSHFFQSFSDCFCNGQVDGFVDPLVHSMEVTVVSEIVPLGCDLIMCLVRRYAQTY